MTFRTSQVAEFNAFQFVGLEGTRIFFPPKNLNFPTSNLYAEDKKGWQVLKFPNFDNAHWLFSPEQIVFFSKL